MFVFTCAACDRVLAVSPGPIETTLHCRDHADGAALPNGARELPRVEFGPAVTAWLDERPDATGAQIAEAFPSPPAPPAAPDAPPDLPRAIARIAERSPAAVARYLAWRDARTRARAPG